MRNKLLVLVLMPLVVVLPLLGVVLLAWGDSAFDRLLITKIRADLAVAHGYFERVLGEVDAAAIAIAESHALQRSLTGAGSERGDARTLQTLLEGLKARHRLDFIELRRGAEAQADDGASVAVLRADEQELLAESQRARVPVGLVPTRNAAPVGARTVEDRAMVLLARRAVRDAQGRAVATLRTGVLLNRNLAFIDHVNQIVYPEGSLPFGSRGTATLFLDDVRISTNVRLFADGRGSDERAIGTRVSQAVRDTVLGSGHTWLDRAFVVNDWYVSAYQPLADAAGARVGMLYVGYTEAPFRWVKYGVLLAVGVTMFVVMVGAAWVCLRWARTIFAPLERMAATMQAVQYGDAEARVGATGSSDELGELAGHLDHLLDAVDSNTRALQTLNAELDAKVAERTRELEAAQGQLVRSEKMAAVGQLTASIAHEVNNPIAVLQGNLDLIRELLGDDAVRVCSELKLADEQIERMRLIVTQLLQFARPTEYAGYVEPVQVNDVLRSSLLLAGHQMTKSRIEVRQELQARQATSINRNELQQVLVNLLVNAIHAMPEGGTLELATQDAPGGVEVVVRDSGAGLGPELIAELFKPFVTRKKDGTWLGLWISRTLVERYGGELLAADRGDGRRGAEFTVRLRADEPAALPPAALKSPSTP